MKKILSTLVAAALVIGAAPVLAAETTNTPPAAPAAAPAKPAESAPAKETKTKHKHAAKKKAAEEPKK